MGQKLFQSGAEITISKWDKVYFKVGHNKCFQSYVLSRELFKSRVDAEGHLVVEKKYLKNSLYKIVIFDYGGGKEAMLVIT